jgi:hypothetical protein
MSANKPKHELSSPKFTDKMSVKGDYEAQSLLDYRLEDKKSLRVASPSVNHKAQRVNT